MKKKFTKLEITLKNAKKLSVKTASVDEISCMQILQFLTIEERIRLIEEFYRVLKPDGKAVISVPYWTSMKAVSDPFVKWPPFHETFFCHFNKKWREENKITHPSFKINFEYIFGYGMDGMWNLKAEEARSFAARHYLNVIFDLHVTLIKK